MKLPAVVTTEMVLYEAICHGDDGAYAALEDYYIEAGRPDAAAGVRRAAPTRRRPWRPDWLDEVRYRVCPHRMDQPMVTPEDAERYRSWVFVTPDFVTPDGAFLAEMPAAPGRRGTWFDSLADAWACLASPGVLL